MPGDHAARAKKAKATEAEGSAAAAALKVVKAQARVDAAAEKKVADAARKVATEAKGSAAAAALKVVKAQARADAAAEKKSRRRRAKGCCCAGQGRSASDSAAYAREFDAHRSRFDAHRSRSDQLKPYAGNLGGECGDGRYDEDITIKRIGRRRRPRGCFSASQCRLREYKKLPPLRNRLPLRYDKKSQPPPPPRLQ